MRLWLVLLILLAPTATACSVMWLPYGQLDMADDKIVTVTGDYATVLDLQTKQSQDFDLGFMASAKISPNGERLATAHQVGLGADCSGTAYRTLREADGAVLVEWQTDGQFYAWDGGFNAGELRNWNGQPTAGPTWDTEYRDVLSADGTTWARHLYYEKILTVTSEKTINFPLDMSHPDLGISDDGTVVGAVTRERDPDDRTKQIIRVAIRSIDGPNWNWTFPADGEYSETQITIGDGVAGVAGFNAYKLDLKTGRAWVLDTDLEAKSVDHHNGLGWMISEENGDRVQFVKDQKAWQKLTGDLWVQPAHPGWLASNSGAPVVPQTIEAQETPAVLPIFSLVALLWFARKV